MQIKLLTRSLSVEVSNFVSNFFTYFTDCSKQAFSQARLKMKHTVFIELKEACNEEFYSDGDYKRWKDYILLSNDGTTMQLPNQPELTAYFGQSPTVASPMTMCRSTMLYDVENKLVWNALIEPYTTDEQEMAIKHLDYLDAHHADKKQRIILLYDMGFRSFEHIRQHQLRQQAYVMRVNETFCLEVRQFANSHSNDQVIEIDLTKHRRDGGLRLEGQISILKVRAVKIALDNGQTEYLLTSLFDKAVFDLASLKELYHKRWGHETALLFQKRYVEIENFSAIKVEGVLQQYHAAILASNIRAVIAGEVQQEIEDEEEEKRKNQTQGTMEDIPHYEVNQAVALGLIINVLPRFLLANTKEVIQIYAQLKKKIKRRTIKVGPNRTFPRKAKNHHRFTINLRPVI